MPPLYTTSPSASPLFRLCGYIGHNKYPPHCWNSVAQRRIDISTASISILTYNVKRQSHTDINYREEKTKIKPPYQIPRFRFGNAGHEKQNCSMLKEIYGKKKKKHLNLQHPHPPSSSERKRQYTEKQITEGLSDKKSPLYLQHPHHHRYRFRLGGLRWTRKTSTPVTDKITRKKKLLYVFATFQVRTKPHKPL